MTYDGRNDSNGGRNDSNGGRNDSRDLRRSRVERLTTVATTRATYDGPLAGHDQLARVDQLSHLHADRLERLQSVGATAAFLQANTTSKQPHAAAIAGGRCANGRIGHPTCDRF